MKTKTLLKSFFMSLVVGLFISVQAQTPKTVCQITFAPVNGEEVITQGHVTSVSGDDDFYITSGGCTIKCDGQSGNIPAVGISVAVQGRVEIDDKKSTDDDELEIDVHFWVEEGGTTPPPPTDAVTTVAEALAADPGTVALLTGTVTSWTDENDGEGWFTDDTGDIRIDFEEGDKPSLSQVIVVLGTVDLEDEGKEIDVYYWYPDGGSPPDPPANIAWTVEEANAAPDGTYAIVPGAVTSWTNENDGEGVYQDLTGSINIDFEDELWLPGLIQAIYVVGIVDTDDSQKEIEAYGWENYSGVGVPELSEIGISIYPNPANDFIYIQTESELDKIQIADLSGKVVMNQKVSNDSRINIANLPKGIYVVTLFDHSVLIGYSKLLIH